MTPKSPFTVDKSIYSFFDGYRYLDEVVLITNYKGYLLASNKEFFVVEFFRKFSYENFNFYKVIDKSYQRLLLKRLSQLKKGEPIPPTEYKLEQVNGHSAYVEVFSMAATYQDQAAIVSLVRDITVKKEIEKKLLYAVVQTEEKERQRFAQDLHDELGPFLSGLKLYLHELNSRDINSQQKKQLIEYLGKMTNEAVEKIRSISSNLMPQNMIETGLAGSLEKTIGSLNQAGTMKISLKTSGSETSLADSLIITVYRIVLELINNSLKHSGASKVNIRLEFKKSMVNLIYNDNGKGFDLKKALEVSKGVGLQSIINRIHLFRGTYKFTNEPGQGIEFNITFRLK